MTTRTSIVLHFDADDILRDFHPPGDDDGPGYAALDIGSGTRVSATLFFNDTAAIDAAIRELAALKSEMLGEPQPAPALPRIDEGTLDHMRGRLAAVVLPGCSASHSPPGTALTAYCDVDGPHDEHRAPGLDEGDPDITWTDEPGQDDDEAREAAEFAADAASLDELEPLHAPRVFAGDFGATITDGGAR